MQDEFQTQSPVEESTFDYDINAPIDIESETLNTVPNQVSSEEAMLGAHIKFPNPTMDQVNEIKNEYVQEGVSRTIENIRKQSAHRQNQQAISNEFKAHTNGEQSLAELEAKLAMTPSQTEDNVYDLHQEMMVAVLGRNQAKNPRDALVYENKIYELVEKGYPVAQAISDRVDLLMSRMPGGGIELTGGILADVLPFATTIPFIQAFNEVCPRRS